MRRSGPIHIGDEGFAVQEVIARLDTLYVVHAGEHTFSLRKRTPAVHIGGLLDEIRRLK